MDASRVFEKILAFLGSFQAQAAFIAALVSIGVAWWNGRRDKKARRIARAEKLLREVYYPISNFLRQRSLSAYLANHQSSLEKNYNDFTETMRPLIDEVRKVYVPSPMGLETDDLRKRIEESENKLKPLQAKLVLLLAEEIERLEAIVGA